MDSKIACANEENNEFIFVGSVLSTGELNSTVIRDTVLQEYLLRNETVNVAGQMIKINRYCSAVVLDESTHRCVAAPGVQATKTPTEAGKHALNLAIEIAIGVGAGLLVFLLLFISCLVLCICCSRREVRTKYKEPRTDDLNVR